MTVRTATTAKSELALAASEAVKVIAQAAEEAAKVIASSTAEALKISNVKNMEDHDLLIELKTRMDGLKTDIHNLTNGTSKIISDHESRILVFEKRQLVNEGRLKILEEHTSDKRLTILENTESGHIGRNKVVLPLVIGLSSVIGGLIVFIIEQLLTR